jgi:hypothetical protein
MNLSKTMMAIAALGLIVGCSGDSKKSSVDDKRAARAAAKDAAAGGGKADAPAGAPAAEEAPAEPAGEPGNVKVTVKYDGTAPARTKIDQAADPYCAKTEGLSEDLIVNGDGTIANAIVYLKKVRGKFDVPTESLKLSQDGCMYIPHIQVGMKGQSVEISNGDKTLHNVHSYKGAKKKNWFNIAQPPGAPAKVEKLKKAELSIFKCDVHPWMSAYILTTDHPFNGVTGDTGSVALDGVPSKAKAYDVVVWHETLGEQAAEVVIEAGKTAEVTVTFKGG